MHVSFHIGAHCTDDDQLIRSLLKNNDWLAGEGIIVPGPSRYRGILAEVLGKLRGGRASGETQDVLLEAITDTDDIARLVLSHENFLGVAQRALEEGTLYHLAAEKVQNLRNLFPQAEVEFFLSIRNLATFLPALFAQQGGGDFAAFLSGIDPRSLSWVKVVEAIRDAAPDCQLTVWCNEDTPTIWPEVLRAVAGVGPEDTLKGGFDIIERIMEREGLQRLRTYLKTHPPKSEAQRRRVLAAFLDKYVIEAEIEEEFDLPGWTGEMIEELTASYDREFLEIARIPGVRVLGG